MFDGDYKRAKFYKDFFRRVRSNFGAIADEVEKQRRIEGATKIIVNDFAEKPHILM